MAFLQGLRVEKQLGQTLHGIRMVGLCQEPLVEGAAKLVCAAYGIARG
jgi:hypothetical protein